MRKCPRTLAAAAAPRSCSETSLMMRALPGFLPSPTMRLSISRTTFVMSSLPPRHCEERSDEAIHSSLALKDGLLRFARNDDVLHSLAALALLHAGIERVARGIADQIDAEDRDRQQQSRPEDQRRLDLKIGAAFGHDVAPGRRLRADRDAEK